MIEPLTLSFEIGCSPEHAFDVWTTRLSNWWPKGHSASGDPDTFVVLEPRLGGRIFERTPDGTEIDWGEITLWSPPNRLGYLWHISRDRSDATNVNLTFVELEDGTTRLDIVHDGWNTSVPKDRRFERPTPRVECAHPQLRHGRRELRSPARTVGAVGGSSCATTWFVLRPRSTVRRVAPTRTSPRHSDLRPATPGEMLRDTVLDLLDPGTSAS